MKMRSSGTTSRTGIAKDISFFDDRAIADGEPCHMQIHRTKALAMINANSIAQHVELPGKNDLSVSDGSDGFAGRSALVHSAVKFPGRLAIVEALHTKGRSNATVDGGSKRVLPKPRVRNFVAKIIE